MLPLKLHKLIFFECLYLYGSLNLQFQAWPHEVRPPNIGLTKLSRIKLAHTKLGRTKLGHTKLGLPKLGLPKLTHTNLGQT